MTPLDCPNGQPFPMAYRWLAANGLVHFTPWHLIERAEEAAQRKAWFERMQRYVAEEAKRDLHPFAYQQATEEVAAFQVEAGRVSERVYVYQQAGTPGDYMPSADVEEFEDVWAWLRAAVLPAMQDFASELDVEELLRNGAA